MAAMNLEDHAGDVVGKARRQAGLDVATVAARAGLSPAAWERFEATGAAESRPDYAAVGELLGLDGAKLAALADGWAPEPPDLTRWREVRVITTRGPAFSVNAFLIWDEVTREAALFDTGYDAAPVLRLIREETLTLRYIFLTHHHGDHVAALAAVRKAHPGARLRAGGEEVPLHERNRASDFLHLGGLRLSNRATPGHSADSVTYLVGNWPEDAPAVAVVGDALFAGSMGHVPGDAAAARRVIREQILSLPADTLICPGHGPLTTVGQEQRHNPFF